MSTSQWQNRHSWVDAQTRKLGIDQDDSRKTVLAALLETWWDLEVPDGQQAQILGLFSELAQARAIDPELFQDKQAEEAPRFRWVQVRPGQIVMRDYVRVRVDAYSGSAGQYHNGRSGPIVAVRNGDIHVMYDDDPNNKPQMAVRHPPHCLEKRIAL